MLKQILKNIATGKWVIESVGPDELWEFGIMIGPEGITYFSRLVDDLTLIESDSVAISIPSNYTSIIS
jgi:hypothetical protein